MSGNEIDFEESTPASSSEGGSVNAATASRLEAAFAERDLRAIGWIWLEGLTRDLDEKNGARAASWARLLHSLGESAEASAGRATEAALYGRLMNGLQPLDAGQWAMAEDSFDAITVEDFRENWGRIGDDAGASPAED